MNDTTNLAISDFRQDVAGVINRVLATQKTAVIFQRSEPKVAVVDVKYLAALEEAFLDAGDATEAERAKSEKKTSLDTYIAKRWGKWEMKLSLTKKAEKELEKLPQSIARNVVENIKVLGTDPYPTNSKKLAGQDNYRLRVGAFRVIYWVDKKNKEITVLRVADRKTVYRF